MNDEPEYVDIETAIRMAMETMGWSRERATRELAEAIRSGEVATETVQ